MKLIKFDCDLINKGLICHINSTYKLFSAGSMNLQVALYPVVEGLAPQTLTDNAIATLCQELERILNSPARSTSQLQSLLNAYGSQIPHSQENQLRWQKLLNVLQLLLEIDDQREIIRYLSAFQSMLIDDITLKSANLMGRDEIPLSMKGLESHDGLMSPLRPVSLQADSFENIDRLSNRRSLVSSYKDYPIHRSVTLHALSEPYYSKTVPEAEMLRFIPYTLLATTSDLFPLELNKVSIPSNISNTESGLLHLIFEAGLLYQELKRTVDKHRSSDISPLKKSLIIQITRVLRTYSGSVNSLAASGKATSLLSVYYEIYDHIVTLRFFDGFIKNFDKTSGDSYLMISKSLVFHGDLLIRRLSRDLSENLLSLYSEYLLNWLSLAKLDATYDEFFIDRSDPSDELSVRLNSNKVPDFIPKGIALKIFVIGKTLIFLGKYCKELQCVSDLSRKYRALYKETNGKLSSEFHKVVHQHYNEVLRKTSDVLLLKFHYKKVVFVLKDILLMGRSDLIDLLIRKASVILGTSSASLSSYELTGYLQESVQQSSLRSLLGRSDSNRIIRGLDARVLDLGHGSVGWDVFTLDYLVDGPLAVVLNVNRPDGNKEYLRIFNFLWRFKKNTYFCNNEWLRTNQVLRDFKKLARSSPLVRDLSSKLSKADVLRCQLQQFGSKLENYCFRSIINDNFQKFDATLRLTKSTGDSHKIPTVQLKSGIVMLDGILKPVKNVFDGQDSHIDTHRHEKLINIDELDKLHNDFLNSILSHQLLASGPNHRVGTYSGQPYPTSLILILNLIFEFIHCYSQLNDVAHEILIQMNLRGEQQLLNNLLIQFNSCLKNTVVIYKNFQDSSRLFIRDLRTDGDDELAKLGTILR